jgi:hypothetical protein
MVLQDASDVIKIAKATKMLSNSVVKMEHDFCTEQLVKGGLLSQLAKAMKPDSLVLVADMVMLARVGEADLPAATMDNIMFLVGGKERTEESFKELFDRAGLELVNVWRASFGAGAPIEARLKN